MQQFTFGMAVTFALLTGCASLGDVPTTKIATATLRQANGTLAGTAILTAAGDRLTVTVAAAGLPQGQHGVHLHMTGRCDAPDFTSAGGHLNPGSRQHGAHNPAGSHLGDLPNITIDGQGKGALSAELKVPREAALAALLDSDGAAIVIHAAADDYLTDPTGKSGARIVCGVFTRN